MAEEDEESVEESEPGEDSGQDQSTALLNDGLRRQIQTVGVIAIFLLLLIAVLVIAGISANLAAPLRSLIVSQNQIQEAQIAGMKRIPDLEAKLAALDQQERALSSTSIGERLKAIEEILHSGNLKPEQIATVQDLTKEIADLKEYMYKDPNRAMSIRQLQEDYHRLAEGLDKLAAKDDVNGRFSQLNDMIKLTWWIAGIVITIVFGLFLWVLTRLLAERRPIPTQPLVRPDPLPAPPAAEADGGKQS